MLLVWNKHNSQGMTWQEQKMAKKGKQLHPKPETVNVRYGNKEKKKQNKWNQEVCKTFGRKNKLSPASMEAMLWLHPLFKCRYKWGFCICLNCLKDPWTKQQKQNPTKIKPTTQQERKEEDIAVPGMGLSLLLGTNWSFLHLQLAFCQHNVGYTEWAKGLEFLFPCQGESQKLCRTPEVPDKGASPSQTGCFESICWIHLLIPLARTSSPSHCCQLLNSQI